VKAYFDTSVLVASCAADHPHYSQAVTALRDVHGKKTQGYVGAYGLAEFYAVMTRVPFVPPILPNEAWQLLSENILSAFQIVSLSSKDYQEAIHRCSQSGWAGGRVYDALHVRSAQKAKCERIYTFNVQHFRQLAPELGDRVGAP
jgi:predicted nucleic acid-binding protein